MSRWFRSRVFKLHTWLGLHVSLFLAFLFLTGAILVVAMELELAGRPEIWSTMPEAERNARFGAIYAAVKAHDPQVSIAVIEKSPRPWLADKTHGRNAAGHNMGYWTDPASGRFLAATPAHGFRAVIRELHDNMLLENRPAFLFVSSMSIVLLVMVLSGLTSYRRFWRGYLRRPSVATGRRSWIGGLHRLLAVWCFPMLLITGLTGVVFFLGGLGIDGATPRPDRASERASILPDEFGPEIIERAEVAARTAMPGFEPKVMVLPRKPVDGLRFIGPQPGAPAILGDAEVAVDPVTMDILGAFTPADSTGLARLKTAVNLLHFGFWGGIVSRVLWVAFGLAAFALAVSGALVYAARLAPAAQGAGRLRVIWRGLGVFRLGYVLVLLAVIGAALVRYGPISVAGPGPDATAPVETAALATISAEETAK